MSFEQMILEKIRYRVYNIDSILKYRMRDIYFTRERKMPFPKVVLYSLCKKGLTSKMEIFDFDEIVNTADISSPAVLKQREKLSAKIYEDMMDENNICFYNQFPEKVKLFKGYILAASDGCEFEIPNTILTRNKCGNYTNPAARAHVDNMYDLLNCFVLGTTVNYGKSNERAIAKENWDKVKQLNLNFPIITVRDRGYMSLKEVNQLNENKTKFVIRLDEGNYKETIAALTSNDETVEIAFRPQHIWRYKDSDPEYCKHMKTTRATTSFRMVVVELENGEKQYLATNLSPEEFTTEDIQKIYKLRWGIESSFHTLKESLKIESITSSKDNLIKQDIYSQMLAFNTIQAFVNANNEKIDQSTYKHKMKTNTNMAVGFFKKYFLYILVEEDDTKKKYLLGKLEEGIKRHIVPNRPGRKYTVNKKKHNKYPINKRKSF